MSDELNLIEQANKAAERIEAANRIQSEIVKRMEAIEARRILGGYSEAGTKAPEISNEERMAIDTKNAFKGTVIERAFK